MIDALMIAAAVALVVFAAELRYVGSAASAARWLLWTVRCQRGARCARLETARMTGANPGDVLVMTYRCGGCGTRYRLEVLATDDGGWLERERVRADRWDLPCL